MIGHYYIPSKGFRWGVLVFILPTIPAVFYSSTKGYLGTWFSEIGRSADRKPFNINVESNSVNAMGRPHYYQSLKNAF